MVAPGLHTSDHSSPVWACRGKAIAFALLLIAAPLMWIGVRRSSELSIFPAFNCIFAALRFLYWDFGSKHSRREAQERLEMHRRMEEARSEPKPQF